MTKVDYTVIRSDRKTLAVEITTDLRVLVRAPRRASKREIARLINAHIQWIDSHLEKQRQRLSKKPPLTDDERIELKKRAKDIIPPLVAHFSELMNLQPIGVKITSAEKRFGSCSGKNSLSFSYLLPLYPMPAIEYIVVHELAHIPHKNHGRDFYALIESILPNYKARKKLLRD